MSTVQLTAAVDSVVCVDGTSDARAMGLAVVLNDGAVGIDVPQAMLVSAKAARLVSNPVRVMCSS
jgi:hypothetical protein